MKRGFLTLLLLFAISHSYYSIEKPWNSYSWTRNNSYIVISGPYEFWEVGMLDPSLSSLELGTISGYPYLEEAPSNVGNPLAAAAQGRNKASSYSFACQEELHRLRLAGIVLSGGTLLLHPVNDVIQTLHLYGYSPINLLPSCSAYGAVWRDTLNVATVSLEQGVLWGDSAIARLNRSMAALQFSGVCDSDYPGRAYAACQDASASLDSVEEGRHALSAGISSFERDSREPLPDFSEFRIAMADLWDEKGLAGSIRATDERINFTRTVTETDYQSLSIQAENSAEQASEALAKADRERLGLIAASPEISVFALSTKEGDIRLAWEALHSRLEEAARHRSLAARLLSARSAGYMKNSTFELQAALREYSDVYISSGQLLEDARQTVSDTQADARFAIHDAQELSQRRIIGPDASQHLQRAISEMDMADQAPTLGSAYTHYYAAAYESRLARTLAEGFSMTEMAVLESKEEGTKSLLASARSDSIDVGLEQSEFDLVKGTRTPAEDRALDSIHSSITEKARLRYGALEFERQELLNDIALSPALSDLAITMRESEGNAFVHGSLDYDRAIGHLAMLEEKYRWIRSEIGKQETQIVQEQVRTESRIQFDPVRLDEPAAITILLSASNPTPFDANNIAVLFDVPPLFNLKTSDIVSSDDPSVFVLENAPSGLKVRFASLLAGARHQVVLAQNLVLAHATKRESRSEASADGYARVFETIWAKIYYPAPLDLDGDALVDGQDYSGAIVQAGSHSIQRRRLVPDAYSESQANYRAVSLGPSSRVEYDILLDPAIDIDTLQLAVAAPPEISKFTAIPAGGVQMGRVVDLGNGIYQAELRNLHANQTAQVHIRYDVNDTARYIEQSLQELNTSKTSPAASKLLSEAHAASAENQTIRAIQKIEEARQQIETDSRQALKDAQRLHDLKGSFSQERDAIGLVLDGSTSTHPDLEKLRNRKDALEAALQDRLEENASAHLARLQKLDDRWLSHELSSLVQGGFKELAQLKVEFADPNATNGSLEQLENSLNRLSSSRNPEDLPAFFQAWEDTQGVAKRLRADRQARQASLSDRLSAIQRSIQSLLPTYSNQQKEARGTPFESYFKLDSAAVQDALKAASGDLRRGDLKSLDSHLNDLERMQDEINRTLATVSSQALAKLAQAQLLYSDRNSSLSPNDRQKAEALLGAMRQRIDQKEPVKALRLYDAFLASLSGSGTAKDDNSLLLLGLTATLILGSFAVYLFQQTRKPPSKPLRKLGSLPKEDTAKELAEDVSEKIPSGFNPLPRSRPIAKNS